MSDHNYDPEQFEAHLKALAEENKLRILEAQRGMYELFDELTESQLDRVKLLLTVISQAPDPAKIAMYWSAWAQGKLQHRFDVSPVANLLGDDLSPSDFA